MDQLTDTAVPVVERKNSCSFYLTSTPKELFYRISFLKMISVSGYLDITFSAYKFLISQQMLPTCIAKPGKKKTYKIVKQII